MRGLQDSRVPHFMVQGRFLLGYCPPHRHGEDVVIFDGAAFLRSVRGRRGLPPQRLAGAAWPASVVQATWIMGLVAHPSTARTAASRARSSAEPRIV